MASSISVRVYKITIHRKGNPAPAQFDDHDVTLSPRHFIPTFINNNVETTQNTEIERSWYFDEKVASKSGNSKGYIHYGTFGFESNLIGFKTKTQKYRRKTSDVEEIPLYYEFWFPEMCEEFGFVVFQSFQGRSCIKIVMDKILEEYAKLSGGFFIRYKKLSPQDSTGGVFATAPIKRLRFVKRRAPGDVADRYMGTKGSDEVDIELSITAKRNKSLGYFGAFRDSICKNPGVIIHDGISFDEAMADIRIGKTTRRVGVFGSDSDVGVIDLTDDIVRGANGHPTFESLEKEVDDILTGFYSALHGD